MPEQMSSTLTVKTAAGYLPKDPTDPPSKFLETPRYTRKQGERLTWMDKRDLEMGYGTVLRMHRHDKMSIGDIAKRTKLPVATVKMVIRDYNLCSHFPSTPEVLKLRVSGKSISQIAQHYGLTTAEIRDMLDGELKQMEGPVGQMAIEVARAERYFEVLEPQIEAGNLAAIQMAVRVAEHKMAVIQTQLETSRDIANAKVSLVDILNQLDAETVQQRPALPAGVVHEAEATDIPKGTGDDDSSPATSVEDC